MLTKRRPLLLTGVTAVLIAIVVVVIIVIVNMPRIERRLVGVHQRSVIRELDRWADESSRITDHESAVRAAGLIDYMSTYYTPGDGYRADSETERQLRNARLRAMKRIGDAISAYTGTVMADPLGWPAELCEKTRQTQQGS